MRDFREYLKEKLKNRDEVFSYLNTALEEYEKDHDTEAFLLALRTVHSIYYESEWMELASRRWQEIEEGNVQCIPADKAMEMARARIRESAKRMKTQ